MNCILCFEVSHPYYTDIRRGIEYFLCPCCDLRFMGPSFRLNAKQEFDRYLTHNNDINDLGYQKFVEPLYELITARIGSQLSGLDYGCGNGPVLTHLLAARGYNVSLYDPFFRPDDETLKKKYDFIFAVEVVEHFYKPAEEFLKLRNLIDGNGTMAIMTLLYSDDIEFGSWTYRNDPTHVCFYSARTFDWIRSQFQFKTFEQVGSRVAWLSC